MEELKETVHVTNPLWDYVKLDFGMLKEKSNKGIFLPESIQNEEMLDVSFYPTVVAVGTSVDKGIQINDKVLIPMRRLTDPQGTLIAPSCFGIEIKEEGHVYWLVRQTDCYAVMRPKDVTNEK